MPNGRMWVWMYNYSQLNYPIVLLQICKWPDHPIIECKATKLAELYS